MPRTARLEELGLPFHVIVQGIERCALFRDDSHRTGFLLRAIRIFTEMKIEVLAWALMDNHVHFVLRATEGRLSKAMQRLLGPYAQAFNRRHGRVGRLFRDRFWSRPVEDDDDLLGLIGYVILNPLRAGIVRDLEELLTHPWTSLVELVTPPQERPTFVARADTLILFASNDRAGVRSLLEMMARQLHADPGGAAFERLNPGGIESLSTRKRQDLQVAATHALHLRSRRIDAVLREREALAAVRLRLERRNWTLRKAVSRAAELCGAAAHRLRCGRRNRKQSRARGLVAHFASTYLGSADAEIARATGIARQSVVPARRRGVLDADQTGLAWQTFFEVQDDEGAVTEAESWSD